MKRIIITLSVLVVLLTSCTENKRARTWGGTSTINLNPGHKLVNMTWKESNLWYLTTPMDSGYVPKTYTFHEESSWGIAEGTIYIRETK